MHFDRVLAKKLIKVMHVMPITYKSIHTVSGSGRSVVSMTLRKCRCNVIHILCDISTMVHSPCFFSALGSFGCIRNLYNQHSGSQGHGRQGTFDGGSFREQTPHGKIIVKGLMLCATSPPNSITYGWLYCL
jgi:hypothetical protein